MSTITIFYHIAKINNWQLIKNEHEQLLEEIPNSNVIENFLEVDEIDQFEVPTLHKLWEYAKDKPDDHAVAYIHSKGVSKPKDRLTRRWRETLNYWVLYKWENHIVNLETNDVSGIRYYDFEVEGNRLPHYSGNFWFARCGYIKSLKDPKEYVQIYEPKFSSKKYGPERYGCEFWIGSGQGKMASIDNQDTAFIKNGNAKMGRGLHSFKYWKRKYG
tara:strand:- start:963 stop:1610 length:648 start_codon:yes stop_codon:yes gene_type:complete